MWKIVPAPSLTHCLRMIMTLQTLGDEKKNKHKVCYMYSVNVNHCFQNF